MSTRAQPYNSAFITYCIFALSLHAGTVPFFRTRDLRSFVQISESYALLSTLSKTFCEFILYGVQLHKLTAHGIGHVQKDSPQFGE